MPTNSELAVSYFFTKHRGKMVEEIQVMHRGKFHTREIMRAQEMRDVRAGIVLANIAATFFVYRLLVFHVHGLSQVQSTK